MITIYKDDVDERFEYTDANSKQRIKYHLKTAHGNNCMICGVPISETYYYSEPKNTCYTIEHVKTRSRYPKDTNNYDNMLGVCYGCNNNRKNNIDVENVTNIKRLNEKIYVNPVTGTMNVKEDVTDKKIENLIETYNLNRSTLQTQRQTCLSVIRKRGIDQYYDELINFKCLMFKFIILNEVKRELPDLYEECYEMYKNHSFIKEATEEYDNAQKEMYERKSQS